MADGARDSTFADPDRVVLWLRLASGHVPSYSGGRCGVPGCRAVIQRGADGEVTIRSFVVDDVSSLLDCSGCRMLMSGSAFEG